MAASTLAPIWSFILAWGFFILVLALFVQMRGFGYSGAPIARQRLERVEAFQGAAAAAAGPVEPRPEAAGEGLSPAAAGLKQPRAPYALLSGWLPPIEGAEAKGTSAQNCYETDFQTRLERTGNYRQLTNNYLRGDPNSCSAPTHELVMPFYKVEPVPFSGCLHE